MDELPTERTAIMIMALKREGRPLIPAFVIGGRRGRLLHPLM
jgi:hypothetical protein